MQRIGFYETLSWFSFSKQHGLIFVPLGPVLPLFTAVSAAEFFLASPGHGR